MARSAKDGHGGKTAKPRVKPNMYAVLSRAVEEGIEYGWNRAHKHTDHPSVETIKDEMERAVMNGAPRAACLA
jgi:hypothetical protein